MKKLMSLLMLSAILLSGCSSNDKVDEEILAIINENLRAADQEDIKAYMATIHPETPAYAQTESGMKFIFKTFDISYEIEDVKIIKKSKNIAKVSWTQYTKN